MDNEYRSFLSAHDWSFGDLIPISPDASNRRYFRIVGPDGSAILMDAQRESLQSFDSFQKISKYLNDIGLSAPKIFATDRAEKLMLIQDLGERTFAQDFALDKTLEAERYTAAISMLCHLQNAKGITLPVATPKSLVDMLNPFFQVPEVAACTDKSQSKLQTQLYDLFDSALTHNTCFSLRDCHVENLIWMANTQNVSRVGILDFQDAFNCDPCYDLVSLLWDVRRDLDTKLREKLLNAYADEKGINPLQLIPSINALKLQRNLRILGIFDRLIDQGKTKYSAFIPRTLNYIHQTLETGDYNALNQDLSEPLARYANKHKAL